MILKPSSPKTGTTPPPKSTAPKSQSNAPLIPETEGNHTNNTRKRHTEPHTQP
jgi:hypothetical protein